MASPHATPQALPQHIDSSATEGGTDCKAFMTGANLFVNRLLKLWDEVEFYVGSSGSEDGHGHDEGTVWRDWVP